MRLRSALAATLVVAVALAVAIPVFLIVQRRQLEESLTDIARQQATAIADQVTASGLAHVDFGPALNLGGDQALIQVVASDGSVVAASVSVEGEPPASTARPAPGETVVNQTDQLPIGEEGDRFVVVVTGVSTGDGAAFVIAAQSLATVERSRKVVTTLLVVGYPLVLLVVGVTSFWLTGRALRSVEDIRKRVTTISGSRLDRRIPVPPTHDEVSRLAETMNEMLARLEAASASQRRFVADASHELRSPLASIRAAVEVGRAYPEQLDWNETSGLILREGERLERLVADLLFLARVDERGLPLTVTDVDLDDLVSAEVTRMRSWSQAHIDASINPVRIRGDAHHLARAIRNLTDNAARHATSRVSFDLSSADGLATVTVSDDGAGIPPLDRDRIFERFVRLDDSRERASGGVGLGLSITREIARAHGGDVTVTPAETGAVLRMTIRSIHI